MADRKKTPDILGSLLGDTSKTEYHNNSKPELQPTSKPVSQKKAEPQEPAEKIKATYYLDAEVVEALEEGWMELRKLADKKSRGQISKSLIVELALQLALEDLEKRVAESSLAKKCR